VALAGHLSHQILVIHMIHVETAFSIDIDDCAALVIFFFLVQLLQQYVHHLQDIGGQQVAEPSQTIWDVFILIHIHVFLKINQYNDFGEKRSAWTGYLGVSTHFTGLTTNLLSG